METAPQGQVQVHLGGGSSAAEANELAMSVALGYFAKANNKDVSDLYVLGMDNSHHGSSTATLSVSSADANPNNLPAFPWPKGEFPQLRYPLAENEYYNN